MLGSISPRWTEQIQFRYGSPTDLHAVQFEWTPKVRQVRLAARHRAGWTCTYRRLRHRGRAGGAGVAHRTVQRTTGRNLGTGSRKQKRRA